MALLSLPGTIAHGLTHLLFGFLVHAKPHGFSIWPRPVGNAWMVAAAGYWAATALFAAIPSAS